MNTKHAYFPHDWTLVEVPFTSEFEEYLETSPLNATTCGMDSEMAKNMRDDVEPFYYDLEQLEAGLDTVYGVSDLKVATQDFNITDEVRVSKGALVLGTYHMDTKRMVRTMMVENI